MRKWLSIVFVVGITLATVPHTVSASATGPTLHYENTIANSIDTGSCGNPWALDTYRTRLTVTPTDNPTTFIVTEKDLGTFVTTGPVSPGACETYSAHGTTVTPGIRGLFMGEIVFTVTDGHPNPDATCVPNDPLCLGRIFGPGLNVALESFKAHYVAGNHGLIYHQWVQSSVGDTGDIASS